MSPALDIQPLTTDRFADLAELFNEGGAVGPELTGYERDNVLYWLENIIDPSAAMRDEFMTFVVATKDGRTLTGLIAEQDKQSVTLKGAHGQAVKLARDRIDEIQASRTSLMIRPSWSETRSMNSARSSRSAKPSDSRITETTSGLSAL